MPAGNPQLERAERDLAAGHYDSAERAVLDALTTARPSARAYRLLADIARARGAPSREAAALEGLIALLDGQSGGDAAEVWARLGTLRGREGDTAGSIAAWQNASLARPGEFEYQRNLARARFAAQDLAGVRASMEALLQRFPGEAFSHVYAGNVHKAYGRADEAAIRYRRALELDAESGEAVYNLVDLAGDALDPPVRRLAIALAERDDLPAADRINAGFAAARIRHRDGDYAAAFRHLQHANGLARDELARVGIRYDAAAVRARFDATRALYARASYSTPLDDLPIDLLPVFVIGLPRSGTTLIEQILASHSAVEAGGELLAARRTEFEFRRTRSAAGREGPVDPGDPTDARLLEDARERYVDALFERGLGGPRVVDKLPANFEIAGFLRLMFPRAPIVLAVRDLRATGFSLYNANFGAHEPWYHDLHDLADYVTQYRRLVAYWREVVPPPFVDVVYEDLVRDTAGRIPALLSAVGLPFEAACIEFHRHDRPILTASHAQVRQPAYTEAIDTWRHYSEWLGAVGELPPR